jgi:hypothetical protein
MLRRLATLVRPGAPLASGFPALGSSSALAAGVAPCLAVVAAGLSQSFLAHIGVTRLCIPQRLSGKKDALLSVCSQGLLIGLEPSGEGEERSGNPLVLICVTLPGFLPR